MDALLARYIEGDLTEDEVDAFLETVERSPELESELRAYEGVLAAAHRPAEISLAANFTDRVMAEAIREPQQGLVPMTGLLPRSMRWMAAAAAVVLVFGGGWFTSRQLAPDVSKPAAATFVMPAAWQLPVRDGDGLQFVRLVYRPIEAVVGQVSVAGSFNGWDPASIPMVFDGQVWSAVLALPPGSYEYMFVEDGQRWVTDPLAPRARSDGFGGVNAVLDITA